MPLSLKHIRIESFPTASAEISTCGVVPDRNKLCAVAQYVGDALRQERVVAHDCRHGPRIWNSALISADRWKGYR